VAAVSHPEPGSAVVRTLAEHPMVAAGETSALRMVAPGSHTAGRFGLVEYRLAPHSPGAALHYHQTFSESFYVLSGRLTVYAGGAWRPYSAGDFALVHERGVHGFRNDGDDPADFLILFAPGIAREHFFAEMAEMRRSGRTLSPEEMTAFYARHDQVMVDV
jgi:quercetin dioxygenase-like cupin family protein